jgi:hypothetical protein
MNSLRKYSLEDWVYGVATSLIAALVFAFVVFACRWLWRWIRNFSAEYRQSDQTSRIVKIFVYRRYIQRTNVYSLSRGQFFILSRCLKIFIGGITVAAMGSFLSWITNMQIPFYLFLGLSVWMFIEAGSWLDTDWSKKSVEHIDEKALSDAAAILGESIEEVRSHVIPPTA